MFGSPAPAAVARATKRRSRRPNRAVATVLEDVYRRAVVRGERSAATVRLVCLALVFVLLTQLYQASDWTSFNPRLMVALGGIFLGAAASLGTVQAARGRTASEWLPTVSVALDTLIVLIISLPNAFWPREDYPGSLHLPGTSFFLLALVMAGLRLQRRVLRFAVLTNALGLLLLVWADGLTGAATIENTLADWVLWTALFAGAGMIGDAVVVRTNRLVSEGATAAARAERARHTLGIYVSEEVADLALDTDELVRGGERRPVSVLFSDLRGFTKHAERLQPEHVVAELNAYLDAMVSEIRDEGGVVDKFVGDAIMVVFGIDGSTDAAAAALRTSERMHRALHAHNLDREDLGLPPLAHGIGVHHGEAVVGNIGSSDRMQFTVIGDAVNVASRLESATKTLGARTVVSRALVEAAGRAAMRDLDDLREVGALPVKGRVEPVQAFALSR